MLYTNNHTKIIGFGTTAILPGETGKLPKGYDEKHPVVAFYISKGYLVKTSPQDAKPANDEAKALTAAQKKAAKAARKKAVEESYAVFSKMTLEELQEEAKVFEIEPDEKDTVETLAKKLAEKSHAE